ncbi:MAG: outer membrane receptor for ferrienterochelin and colicin [Polaribacter sp.]|jgi:outer membrane receptor for ferrienterochelin and colicin
MRRNPKKNTLLLFIFSVLIQASSFAQINLKTPVSFTVNKLSVPEALDQLAGEYQINIAYSEHFFPKKNRLTLDYQNIPLGALLKEILKGSEVGFKFQNDQLILFRDRNTIVVKRKFTVNGYVAEDANGEKLIGVNVVHRASGKWANTNEYGFYSITVPEGKVKLSFSYLGCELFEKELLLNRSERVDVSLKSASTLSEIIVMPTIDSAQIQSLANQGKLMPPNYASIAPGIGGEVDVLNMATTLPGVQTGADGFGGLYVRGGEAGQNLMLLDGVPIYNPGHLLGIFSVYNTDAIRSAKLLKGRFPARYGGRLSSVFDVRSKEGNQKRWTGKVASGLVSAKMKIEGPLFKKKGGLLLAIRKSHSSFLLDDIFNTALFQASSNVEDRTYSYSFHDVNGKLHFPIGKKDRLFLSYYKGKDSYINVSSQTFMFAEEGYPDVFTFKASEEKVLTWGNETAAIRWNRIWGPKLFSNTTLTFSDYNYQNTNFNEFVSLGNVIPGQVFFSDQRASITDQAAKIDFNYILNSKHDIRFGLNGTRHELSPYVYELNESFSENESDTTDFEDFTDEFEKRTTLSYEWSAYVEDEFKVLNNLKINAGLRASAFNGNNGEFFNLEPRLSFEYQPLKTWLFRGGVSRMVQYLHQISSTGLSLPSDIWLPATDEEKPLNSWVYELGLTKKLSQSLSLSLDVYYKKMKEILLIEELGLGNAITINEDFSIDGLISGSGDARGVELLLQKEGKTGGWLSYSWAKTNRNFEDIYQGKSFTFRFDHRHSLNLFAYHQFNKHWHVSMNWKWNSANPEIRIGETSRSNTFVFDPYGEDLPEINTNLLRTQQRGKAYHRLDANINYQFNVGKTKQVLKIGAFNVYNRANPAFYTYNRNLGTGAITKKPTTLLKFTPSFYYSIEF